MTTPHPDWPKTLDWIEKQGQESLKSRFDTAEILAKEAQTTLTVLLAAIGGSAAYGAKIFEAGASGPMEIAAAVTCAYLVVLALALVAACMMFISYPALRQDPANLMHPNCSLDEIREAELNNLGERITEAAAINAKRAKRLNRLRIAVALSPLLFAAVAALSPAKPIVKVDPSTVSCRIDVPTSTSAGPIIDCKFSR